MVSKRTIVNAIDLLNMDQCELADRVVMLEKEVATLNGKLKSLVAAPKILKTAPKSKMSKEPVAKKATKKASKKVTKRPVGRPSNKKK